MSEASDFPGDRPSRLKLRPADPLPVESDLVPVRNVYQRLAAVMERVKYIQNEKKAGMRYRIVSHDKVTALVRPELLAEGVIYHPVSCTHIQNGNRTEVELTVRFVSVEDGSFFDVPSLGYGVDDQDKGPGKAISYAVKYALLKALGMETGEDPDETQDETADYKSTVRSALETAIAMSADVDELTGVGHQIAEAGRKGDLNPAEVTLVRGKYRLKLNELKAKPARKGEPADESEADDVERGYGD